MSVVNNFGVVLLFSNSFLLNLITIFIMYRYSKQVKAKELYVLLNKEADISL